MAAGVADAERVILGVIVSCGGRVWIERPQAGSNLPPLKKGGRSRPAIARARLALDALFPEGVPPADREPNKRLHDRVCWWLKNERLLLVSENSTLRAAGRKT